MYNTIAIIDNNGTTTIDFETEKEYLQYLKEMDENRSKTACAFVMCACVNAFVYYGALFFILYSIYHWCKKSI